MLFRSEDWNFCRCANRDAKIRAARLLLLLLMEEASLGDDDSEDTNSTELVAVGLEHCFVTSSYSSLGLAEESDVRSACAAGDGIARTPMSENASTPRPATKNRTISIMADLPTAVSAVPALLGLAETPSLPANVQQE